MTVSSDLADGGHAVVDIVGTGPPLFWFEDGPGFPADLVTDVQGHHRLSLKFRQPGWVREVGTHDPHLSHPGGQPPEQLGTVPFGDLHTQVGEHGVEGAVVGTVIQGFERLLRAPCGDGPSHAGAFDRALQLGTDEPWLAGDGGSGGGRPGVRKGLFD